MPIIFKTPPPSTDHLSPRLANFDKKYVLLADASPDILASDVEPTSLPTLPPSAYRTIWHSATSSASRLFESTLNIIAAPSPTPTPTPVTNTIILSSLPSTTIASINTFDQSAFASYFTPPTHALSFEVWYAQSNADRMVNIVNASGFHDNSEHATRGGGDEEYGHILTDTTGKDIDGGNEATAGHTNIDTIVVESGYGGNNTPDI